MPVRRLEASRRDDGVARGLVDDAQVIEVQ